MYRSHNTTTGPSIPPRFALALLVAMTQAAYAADTPAPADADSASAAGVTAVVEIRSTLNTASSSAPSKG